MKPDRITQEVVEHYGERIYDAMCNKLDDGKLINIIRACLLDAIKDDLDYHHPPLIKDYMDADLAGSDHSFGFRGGTR